MVLEAGFSQIGLWAAYVNLEPIGAYRADLRQAYSDALYFNARRDRERHPSPYTVRDFLLFSRSAGTPEASVGERLRGTLATMGGGRRGADLKAWQSANRKRVGTSKA